MSVLKDRLPAYGLFGAVLSGAGLPIYIYAPKFYADNYGVNLALLGTVLFGLRLFDVVQDPALGYLAERLRRARVAVILSGAALLSVSMLGLFAVVPPVAPVLWFALTITGLFSAFSFLSICFYGRGVAKAAEISGGHFGLAAWREGGALLGVCIAAVAPTVMTSFSDQPYSLFAIGFAAIAMFAAVWMIPEWASPQDHMPSGIREIFGDGYARRLLILALVNATPLAITSTLFLFYVEGRLGAAGWEGPLLVLFFLAAAASAPLWSRLALAYGERKVLLSAMVLAILSFAWALTLGTGDVIPFAVICVASGASIGADLTLLPAMFARRMSVISPNGAQGFGLWSLVNKFTLAFAAVLLLPLLESSGYVSGAPAPDSALWTLSWLYAGLPSALKVFAILLLLRLPDSERDTQ